MTEKYMRGLDKKTKEKRQAHFDRMSKKDDDDPSAYNDAPGDDVDTKPSNYTKKYKKMFGESDSSFEKSIQNKSEETGVPFSILKKVADRGIAAYRTGHRPGTTEHQWALARINSFVTGGKTSKTADKDLYQKAKKYLSESKFSRFEQGLRNKAKEYDIEYKAALQIAKRAIKAYSNSDVKYKKETDPHQWAYSRIDRFIHGDIDQDLMELHLIEKNVELDKPFRTPKGPKKFAVYVKNEKGNVIIVRFGDPNMKIKTYDDDHRKAFRARHNCTNAKDKTSPKYWSCKMWSTKDVDDHL